MTNINAGMGHSTTNGYPKDGSSFDEWSRSKINYSQGQHRRPGLGVQIDAMIARLKEDGHSPANMARVMRLRCEQLEGGEG